MFIPFSMNHSSAFFEAIPRPHINRADGEAKGFKNFLISFFKTSQKGAEIVHNLN